MPELGDGFPPAAPPTIVNPTQRRLLAQLEDSPGRSLQEIADHLGVTRTAAVYHVRRLERRGLVSAIEQGNRRLHFPKSVMKPAERSLLGVFRLRNARCVAEAIQQDPTISWRALAKKLNVAAQTVRWHVARLEEEGLIRVVEQHGRRHYIALHPDLQAAVHPGHAPAVPAAAPGAPGA